MEIEKEIKQDKFNSVYHKAVVNLIYTSNWMQNSTARFLKKYDLTEPQYNILRILRGQNGNPISVLDIQSRMLDKMSNASRLIEKLRLKNLVDRTECPNDRRQVDVKITQDGLDRLKTIDPIMNSGEDALQNLTEEEAFELNRILNKIRD